MPESGRARSTTEPGRSGVQDDGEKQKVERKRYIKGKFNVIQNDNACNHYKKHKNSIGRSCGKSEAQLWLCSAVQGLRRHLSGGHEVGLGVAGSLGG
jgi:hypothetical protein